MNINKNDLKFFKPSKDYAADIFKIEKDSLQEIERYSLNSILENLENYINVIACLNDQCVGYLCCSSFSDEAELLKICVLNEFQGLKIGFELMQELIANLKFNGVKTLFLEVRSDNTKAIKFYEKFGFEKISERKNYYADGTSALIYKYIIL